MIGLLDFTGKKKKRRILEKSMRIGRIKKNTENNYVTERIRRISGTKFENDEVIGLLISNGKIVMRRFMEIYLRIDKSLEFCEFVGTRE